MRTFIYGYSDDIVAFEEKFAVCCRELDAYDKDVLVMFDDGTIVRVHYGKPNLAVWEIKVEVKGTAQQNLQICNNENDDIYSDIFEIEADYMYSVGIPIGSPVTIGDKEELDKTLSAINQICNGCLGLHRRCLANAEDECHVLEVKNLAYKKYFGISESN